MRPESKQIVKVRHIIIGGPKVCVCLPLAAGNRSELLLQARDLASLKPDLLEWRIDSYEGVGDITGCMDTLSALRLKIGEIPVIFTCRIHREGGAKEIAQDHRLNLITSAIQSGNVDIIDVEMCNEPGFIESVKEASEKQGTRLILSGHHFERTPDEAFICDQLVQAQNMGADIAKLAVMPESYGDVLSLFNATYRARIQDVQIPIVTMAMGMEGGITRVAGGLFGSDITFAIGREATAPGQIPFEKLKRAMDVIY